jgi:hypothetical protein
MRVLPQRLQPRIVAQKDSSNVWRQPHRTPLFRCPGVAPSFDRPTRALPRFRHHEQTPVAPIRHFRVERVAPLRLAQRDPGILPAPGHHIGQAERRPGLGRIGAQRLRLRERVDPLRRCRRFWFSRILRGDFDPAMRLGRDRRAYNNWYITRTSTYSCTGWRNAAGRRPTISKPSDCHSRTARSLVLTTKLNCIAR